MMEEQNNWIDQLNIMQSNIMSLFQGILKERNEYKESTTLLVRSLKHMIGRIDNLEKQNEVLQKCNSSMKNIFGVGLKTFRKLDFSCEKSINDNKVSLELLQKLFLESSEKIEVKSETAYKTQFSSEGEENNVETENIKAAIYEDKIKVNKFDLENSNVPTLVNNQNKPESDERGEPLELNISEKIVRNRISKKCQSTNDLRTLNDACNSEQIDTTVCKPSEPSPQVNGNVMGSPVFKDARKQDVASCLRSEGNKILKSTSLKLINEKFLEKSVQLLLTPMKSEQADGSSTSKGQYTPKRGRSTSKFSSPNRSPITALKKSNSREVEGGRKLTQTFLNIDCFKQSPVTGKNSRNVEVENVNKRCKLENVEDDDIIFDSPKRGNQVLEEKKDQVKNEIGNRCLDETFISSPTIRKFNSDHNRVVEEIMKNQLPCNNSREKSPEYDSVPFVYKREAVRKKNERMKLPGHPCVECDKYYRNAMGELNTNDFEKILNKCSRHRDKNPPALDDTPPGYWKPYLTCTTIFSPMKDDAR